MLTFHLNDFYLFLPLLNALIRTLYNYFVTTYFSRDLLLSKTFTLIFKLTT